MSLSALLSQVFVAFAVELDNEFEHRMPHWTTNQGRAAGSPSGPWLTSMAMWSNCMRFVGEEGVSLGELEALARTKTNLNGMQRWGYVVVEPGRPASRSMIRATAKGRMAREVWGTLFGEIEQRWRERYGAQEIDGLRESLWVVAARMDPGLPDCLPILGYGLFSRLLPARAPAGREDRGGSALPLPALLARVLLAFAAEFESGSELSLAVAANVLRVLDDRGVRVRDIPLLSGVSKEAIAVALGLLQKGRDVVVEPDPSAARTKVVRLTAKGMASQDAYRHWLGVVEDRWKARFGEETVRALREALERLAGDPAGGTSPLFRALEPYPEGWRASVRKPLTLPHYPMVLHRGGFPDGS